MLSHSPSHPHGLPANEDDNERLRFALASSGIGTWDVDLRQNQVYWDDRCRQLYGFTENESPAYNNLSSFIHPDDRADVDEAIKKALDPALKCSYDVSFRPNDASDQTCRWLQCIGKASFDDDGVANRFSGIVMDISAEMKAGEKLQSARRPADQSITSFRIDIQEADLKAEENRFRIMVDQAPVAMLVLQGPEMIFETVNQPMLDLLGKTKHIIGKPLLQGVPELTGQATIEILQEVYRSGKIFNGTDLPVTLLRNDVLEDLYITYNYTPLKENGVVHSVIQVATDVTAQVKARKLLEESELFARSIFENSPVAKLVFVGRDMVIKSSNENMLAMLGRDSSVIGLPLSQAVPELAATVLPERYRHVMETGETYYQPEERFDLIKFGKPYSGYYNYIYKALRNSTRQIYGVMVTATEVTDQVVAREKIREAEESLRGAVELAELGTWSLDLDSRLMEYSSRLRTWFGFDEVEEISIAKAYSAILPEHWPFIKESMRGATDSSVRSLYDVEYSLIDKNTGVERILHAQGKASFDDKGVAYKVTGTAQDVTKQRQLQLALEQEVQERTIELKKLNEELLATNDELFKSNEQLLHSNEELAQYAYVASHDLQEPLRKIRLYSGLLEEIPGLPGKGNIFVTKIIQSSERMTMLIRDLLEFSRLLKSDRLMRPVDLGLIAEAVKTDFELSIIEKKAEVTIGKLPEIDAVNLQMNQLFYNLLGNALKFTSPGKTPQISVTATEIDAQEIEKFISKPLTFSKYYRISFRDNGIGFDVQYSEQIFEVFKRLHGRDIYPGSGIGLALCRRIVSNHHGHLYAESEPGKGTSFHIILPDKQQNIQSNLPENFTWADKTI